MLARIARCIGCALACLCFGAQASDPYTWHLPRGFPIPAVPADNPMSQAKVALGRRLFFETRLSVNGQASCASCHQSSRAFSDGRPVAIGALGDHLPHSAMPLVNVAYNISFGWTRPELRSLESQMLQPLLNEHPIELGMAGRQQAVCADLSTDAKYREAFSAAFPEDGGAITIAHVVKAIASFERTLISGDSPFDRYVFGGDHAALSAEAKRGMALFYSVRSGCGSCHSGFNFDGNWRDSQGETGRPGFALNGTGEMPTRVPTLRNVAITAPYMHDGRFATLDAVLDHYSEVAQQSRRARRPDTIRLRGFDLSPAERAELIAFLRSLTDDSFLTRAW